MLRYHKCFVSEFCETPALGPVPRGSDPEILVEDDMATVLIGTSAWVLSLVPHVVIYVISVAAGGFRMALISSG